MRRIFLVGLMLASYAQALVVEKPGFRKTIQLRIIRAEPDSFETYNLMNANGREMMLVCSHNRVYDDNLKAFIRYRNFFNEEVGDFIIQDNQVCREMGRFIENISLGVDDEHPFLITLSTDGMKVQKIVYPNLDIFTDDGTLQQLLPKAPTPVKSKAKPNEVLVKKELM